MADPIGLASSIIALVAEVIVQSKEAQRSLFTVNDNSEELRKFEYEFRVSNDKFRLWTKKWSGEDQRPRSSEELWGVQGWENVRSMLSDIEKFSVQIEKILKKHLPDSDSHAKSRWISAIFKVKKRDSNDIAKLQLLSSALKLRVDAIWIYAETIFDSKHGVLGQDKPMPSRDTLITHAIQSRTGSIKLYDLCQKSPTNFSLAMDLLAAEGQKKMTAPLHERDGPLLHLQYQLFATEHSGASRNVLKMMVESIQRDTNEPVGRGVDISNLQLFKLDTSKSITIPVAAQGSAPPSILQIDDTTPEEVLLKSQPESLTKILQRLNDIGNISNDEHLSIGAKVELAYKVVESGFFLLGTPWFSSLSSRNILRLKAADRTQRHGFVLEIQTIDMNALLFDDSEALAETSQLFHIGVLLMEIALENPESASRKQDYSRDENVMTRLPLVEQNMGAQYCKATAFCLQHRRSRFQGPEKYSGPKYVDWEKYLAQFLEDFYSHVYLRLEELRDVDTKAEFRSRKSWMTG
ncbi:uncharacterized protein KY384_007482 [Bacidia gigantensis]|uniref:uncharacterized protein n=1 Tax=Bacidia gigantensis TaxID=2732470 RepID=UPI001D057B96|nr:uncharacterized protein KY384_007482 [Bacidia gigantensis]KAG8527330.1 hypothetical protein KY384_007482 [Bacidia gigantensis]